MKWKSKTRFTHGEIVGERISAPEGVFLGRIERVVHEVNEGRIEFVLVRFASFLGLGPDLFALPWSLLHRRPGRSGFVFRINREQLEKAPTFSPGGAPKRASEALVTAIEEHFGLERVAS